MQVQRFSVCPRYVRFLDLRGDANRCKNSGQLRRV